MQTFITEKTIESRRYAVELLRSDNIYKVRILNNYGLDIYQVDDDRSYKSKKIAERKFNEFANAYCASL